MYLFAVIITELILERYLQSLKKDLETMANEEHLEILKQGIKVWNKWRKKSGIQPDLSGADLSDALLWKADLREAKLCGANLHKADLWGADLTDADLRSARMDEAHLSEAILYRANFSNADLLGSNFVRANLMGANFTVARLSEANLGVAIAHGAIFRNALLNGIYCFKTDMSGADLRGANLRNAQLLETNLRGANLAGCNIYGVSAWGVELDDAKQQNLIITDHDEPVITADNIAVAQFIYLLLNNASIRDVIDTVAKKAVLILGRFTPERKTVLDAIREELRSRDFLPILFDFVKPSSRNITETISTLAHMSRFVIADITDAGSIPQELQRIVPDLPSLPVQPLILASQYEYGMFSDFLDYHSVLTPYRYNSLEDLISSLEEKVIDPALVKAKEIEERRRELGK
jgi:hypothetical protein